MAMIDPERERAGLAERYRQQSDAELKAAASEAHELTELARAVLHAECAKRGLDIKLAQYPSGDEIEMRNRVTIRWFRDLQKRRWQKTVWNLKALTAHWWMTTSSVWTGSGPIPWEESS